MNLEDIYNSYAFNDGETLSIRVDFSDCSCAVNLLIRKAVAKKRFEKCEIELLFGVVTILDISEDFRTNGGFTDITFTKNSAGNFYLSLDPYGNTGEPHEKDNFIIVGSSLTLIVDNGDRVELS